MTLPVIGTVSNETQVNTTPTIKIDKDLLLDGEELNQASGSFDFKLSKDEQNSVTVSTDENGEASIKIPKSWIDSAQFDKDGKATITLTLEELGEGTDKYDENISYDKSKNTITLTIKRTVETHTVGYNDITTTVYTVEDLKKDTYTFTNKYDTFELDLSKVDGDSKEEIKDTDENGNRKNAEFTLYDVDTKQYFGQKDGKWGWYDVEEGESAPVIAVTDGKLPEDVKILLKCDKVYLLKETTNPDGYVKDPITYVIANEEGYTKYSAANNEAALKALIKNYTDKTTAEGNLSEAEKSVNDALKALMNKLGTYDGADTEEAKLEWIKNQIKAIENNLNGTIKDYNGESGNDPEALANLKAQYELLNKFVDLNNKQNAHSTELNALETGLNTQITAAETAKNNYNTSVEALNKYVEEQNKAIDELTAQMKAAQDRADEYRRQFNSLSVQLNNLIDRSQNTRIPYSERLELVGEINSLRSRMQSLRDSISGEKNTFDALNQQRDDAKAAADQEYADRLGKINGYKKAADDAKAEFDRLSGERTSILSGFIDLYNELEKLNLNDEVSKFGSLKSAYEEARLNAIKEIVASLDSVKILSDTHNDMISDYQDALQNYQDAVANLGKDESGKELEIYKSVYNTLNKLDETALKKLLEGQEIDESLKNQLLQNYVGPYGWLAQLGENPTYNGKDSISLKLDLDFINYLKQQGTSFGSSEVKYTQNPWIYDPSAPETTFDKLNSFELNGLVEVATDEIQGFDVLTLNGPDTVPDTPDIPEDPETSDDPTPETPTEDVPNEPTPLTDIPDAPPVPDIPDEEVPLAEMLDEEVPLADAPEELTELPEDPVPLAAMPPLTGDVSMFWLYLVLMLAGGALVALRKKEDIEG